MLRLMCHSSKKLHLTYHLKRQIGLSVCTTNQTNNAYHCLIITLKTILITLPNNFVSFFQCEAQNINEGVYQKQKSSDLRVRSHFHKIRLYQSLVTGKYFRAV